MNRRFAARFVCKFSEATPIKNRSPRATLPFACAGIVAAILIGGAASTAFAAASLTPLGILPGDTTSGASGVSADGSVIVGTSVSDGFLNNREAFRWTSDGGMVGLGYLPGGFFESGASRISADGSIIVGTSKSNGYSDQAFRWTSNGGMVGLGWLPGGGNSVANGVSADGSVVVGWNLRTAFEAFRWTSDGGMVGLGDLPGGSFGSGANDVSGDGSVIVGNSTSASGQEAFRWTNDGGMVGLGDLPGGSFHSWAMGVSGDGSVVVGYGTSASGQEAFRWTSDGGMVGLGKLPGANSGINIGVSGDGSIVVGSNNLDSGPNAFYWIADGGMQSLWDVLLTHGVDPATDGWSELVSAADISADGNTIVGRGIRNGNTEAFVAVIPTTVPEPTAATIALLVISSGLLLRQTDRVAFTQGDK